MDPLTRWRLKQPVFWLGLLWAICNELIATNLVPSGSQAARIVCGIMGVLGLYGINSALQSTPPRVPLIDMSAAKREEVFNNNPGVRERFYLEHPEMAPIGWRMPEPAPLPPLPAAPPPPPATGKGGV